MSRAYARRPPRARRRRLRLLAALWVLLACGREASDGAGAPVPPGTPPRARPDAPDVLLITVDTLRADQLGAYGSALGASPNVDALAARSVVFERAVAAASVTAPAHASIMTSRWVREHSVGWLNGPTQLVDSPTLAQLFRDSGYDTAGFVGNLMLQRRLGFHRGFDVFDDELPAEERNRPLTFERIAGQTAERALAWLGRPREAPVFLWVHLQDPHGPYEPPGEFAARFAAPRDPSEPPLPVLENDVGLSGIPAYQALPGLVHASEYRSRYAGEIAYADHWLGRILEAFDAQPRGPGVVLFTADHGESMGEAYRYFSHGHTTTPEVAHVPLLLRAPGLAPGRRPELVSHVDVLPTLLELAGLPLPGRASGIALGPYLRGGRPLPERVVYCDVGRELTAYRRDAFVRVRGTGDAWLPPETRGGAPTLSWSMYAWEGGPEWRRLPVDAALKSVVRAYADRAEPMAEAPPIEYRDLERLRALGYAVE
jgi:arylsulfatase